MTKKIKKIKPEDYWRLRTEMAEMQMEDIRLEMINSKLEGLLKTAQVATLEADLFRVKNLQRQKAYREETKRECDKFTAELEQKLKISFKSCDIDPVTFEIIELGENK